MTGGGGGDQVTKFEAPDWTKPYYQQDTDPIVKMMEGYMGNMPVYRGERVADLDPRQWNAINNINDYATYDPKRGLSNAYIGGELNGLFIPQSMKNQYAGDSPYFEAMLGKQRGDMVQDYQKGTAAQTDAAAARSGAFGGSAYNEQTQANQKTLADSLANMENTARQAQYDRSANLEENYINRETANKNTQLQRMLQATGMIPSLQQGDMNMFLQQMGTGDVLRNLRQQYDDANQQQWWEEAFGPARGADMLMNALRQLSGQSGTTTQALAGYSPWANIIGAGLTGASLFK